MKSHDFCLRISWKIAKGNVWAKFYGSIGCGSCINKGFLIFCTNLHRNPMQASNFGGTLTNFSFEFFNKMFTEDASLLLLSWCKKSQKWPKTQIKGGSLGRHQWTKIRWKPSSGETSGHLFVLLSRPLNLRLSVSFLCCCLNKKSLGGFFFAHYPLASPSTTKCGKVYHQS